MKFRKAEDQRPVRDGFIARDADAAGKRRRRLGEAAHRRVTSLFLIDRYVRDFERTYETLLARPAETFTWRQNVRWPRAYNDWIRHAVSRRVARLASSSGRA